MISIIADSTGLADVVSRALSPGVRTVTSTPVTEHLDLASLAVAVQAVVVCCLGPLRPTELGLLRKLEVERPWVPAILVTHPDPELTRHRLRVRLAEVVPFDDLEDRLPSAVEAARATTGLECLASALERSSLPPALRKALAHAVRQAADRPTHDVVELAKATGCKRVTLFQQFKTGREGSTTLSAFLGGLSVLRAHELRRSGMSWRRVVKAAGISAAALTRRVESWPGGQRADLERMSPDVLLAAFVAAHVQPLLAPNSGRENGQRPRPNPEKRPA